MDGDEGAQPTGQQQEPTPGGQAGGGAGGQQPNGQPGAVAGAEQQDVTKLPKWVQTQLAQLQGKVTSFETEKSQAEQQRRQAEQANLLNEGKYKEASEKAIARVAELEAQLAQKDHEALKSKIAAEYKLDNEIAAFLTGKTEADLKASAATLAKHLKAPVAPNTEPGKQTGKTTPQKPSSVSEPAPSGGAAKKTYAFQQPGEVSWG